MSIVFASIAPHPPLLIPTIGKENLHLLAQTEKAYAKLEQELYSAKPDTIIIISPHGEIFSNTFSINLSPDYIAEFSNFGDLATKTVFSGNVMLAHRIRESLETKAPLQLISNNKLDHGSSIPLIMLTGHLPKIKIIPIYYSGLSLEAHYNFGNLLKREILVAKERVAVIASGDLSHKLTKNSPAGYSAKAKKFDKKLVEYIQQQKIEEILGLNPELISEVSECGLRSIIILLGILEGTNYSPQLLSYEFPFGVGYLTMKMKL